MIRREKLGAQAMAKYINTDVYTELDYLQTNGYQYVNTHLRCTENVEIELEHHSYISAYKVPIISDCLEDGSSNIYISRAKVDSITTFGGSSVTISPMFGYENVTVTKVQINVSGFRYLFSNVESFTSGDIYLFTNPVFGFGTYYSRIYKVIFTIDGVVHTIIPVLDENGVPCMYNKKMREFYYNEGEGEFVYGFKS